jgi:hypothetical protein
MIFSALMEPTRKQLCWAKTATGPHHEPIKVFSFSCSTSPESEDISPTHKMRPQHSGSVSCASVNVDGYTSPSNAINQPGLERGSLQCRQSCLYTQVTVIPSTSSLDTPLVCMPHRRIQKPMNVLTSKTSWAVCRYSRSIASWMARHSRRGSSSWVHSAEVNGN